LDFNLEKIYQVQ
jgi:hypothetical protein